MATEAMIERVARAIWRVGREDTQFSEDECWHECVAEARAAILAMGEPTEEMALAGIPAQIEWNEGCDYRRENGTAAIYRAMILAALEGGKGTEG